jgi:hypothetical protein
MRSTLDGAELDRRRYSCINRKLAFRLICLAASEVFFDRQENGAIKALLSYCLD